MSEQSKYIPLCSSKHVNISFMEVSHRFFLIYLLILPLQFINSNLIRSITLEGRCEDTDTVRRDSISYLITVILTFLSSYYLPDHIQDTLLISFLIFLTSSI